MFDSKTVGTKQDYIDTYGDKPLGVFIRSIVGMDKSAAQDAFADFIQTGSLWADQMTFMNTIITYLTKNGIIDKEMLFEAPFTNIHDQALLGVFDKAAATKVIWLIGRVNGNVLLESKMTRSG